MQVKNVNHIIFIHIQGEWKSPILQSNESTPSNYVQMKISISARERETEKREKEIGA